MPNYLFKTRGNSSPQNKPRVYFTCHPDDFERYFNKICEDIFKTHDCAIYYTEDMTESIPDEDKPTDLGSMNLFVVPVTFRLLSKPNRAMDDDLAYAKKEHIAILPFMMESGIDEFYARSDKFGELQYINPYSHDLTEISYEEKLKKYLESVLISEETAKRVRAAFDAYIFLSYRKKDRRYANELMRLIHAKPEFRDIAIWYDEFLTPGESFNENIRRMMKESKLFTLLVTPNLLEKPDGKPNYVMEHEYPDARDAGMEILPAEMEETDKDALKAEYAGIPECADPGNEEEFHERLVQSLGKIARAENDGDPEHNYLIGLAYLDGIDVETDKERGLALITKAAEAELPEAMRKLYEMYIEGINVALDYRKAVIWAERLANYCTKNLGEEHPDTLTALNNLAVTYGKLGDHR
ncbi:MAG: toll/interleukin-1 receptor domain-containing protein, partial [Eubacteriales bacterium]